MTDVSLRVETEFKATLLPRCAGCHAPHPLASGDDREDCPVCRHPVAAPREIDTETSPLKTPIRRLIERLGL